VCVRAHARARVRVRVCVCVCGGVAGTAAADVSSFMFTADGRG